MSSVQSHIAQRRSNFVTFPDNNSYGPAIYTLAQIEGALSPYSSYVKLGSLYTVSAADLDNAIDDLDNAANNYIDEYEYTAVDLGNQIQVGVQGGQNDLVVFRKVKRVGNIASQGEPRWGSPATGYVVIANKLSADYSNNLYVGTVCQGTY